MKEIIYGKQYTINQIREIFDLPIVNGGKLSQQLKNISKEYDLVKVKRGVYIINSKISLIKKIENEIYNKNKDYIEPMIYTMLYTTKSNSITMDMHELMTEIEIVNKDFNYIKWHTKECAEIMNQDEVGLEIFTKESEPILKRIIRDVLYDMQDKQLIKVIEIPVIAYKTYDCETKTWFTTRQDITKDKDIQKLLEIKRIVLNRLGLKKESDLGFYERSNFRDLIAKEYQAHYFYYKYKIILNKKGLTDNQNYDIIQLKKSFNTYIQNKLQNSKQGNLKKLNEEEKQIYIKYCIDTEQDYQLRNRRNYGKAQQ